MFFGYFINKELVEIIKIEHNNKYIDINNLVVNPVFLNVE